MLEIMSAAKKNKRRTRGKRKDYKKLDSPSSFDDIKEVLQQEEEGEFSGGCDTRNRGDASPDEDQLECLAEELRVAEERLQRKEEFNRMTKRKEEVKLALERVERKDSKVNASSLRGIDSVVRDYGREIKAWGCIFIR